jgi:hypothetical protein
MTAWRGCEKKRSWPDLRHYTGIYLERPRKAMKILRSV